MNGETKEYTMDDLEDIIREYSSRRPREQQKLVETSGDTVRMDKVEADTVRFGAAAGDTVRLDRPAAAAQDTKPLPDPDEDVRVYEPPKKRRETPVTPPPEKQQPIAFPHKNPVPPVEDRRDAPAEKTLQRLRTGLIVQLVLFVIGALAALFAYQTQLAHPTVNVLVQLVLMLLTAAVGYRRIWDGIQQLKQKRFPLTSLLAVSFAVCLLEGLVCLFTHEVPVGAVFSMQMLMAQWAEYQKQQTSLSQQDTLRKATDLTAVVRTDK